MADVLKPSDVERELVRMTNELGDLTEAIGKAGTDHAKADIAYRRAYNRAIFTSKARAADVRKAEAETAAAEEYEAAQLAYAVYRELRDRGHNIRAQMEALRSVNANVRTAAGLR